MLSWMTAAIVGFITVAFASALPSYFALAIVSGLALLIHLVLRSRLSAVWLAFSLAVVYASFYGHWRVSLLLPEGLKTSDFIATVEVRTVPEPRQGFTTYYRFDANLIALACDDDISAKRCRLPSPYLGFGIVQLNWYADSPPQFGDIFTATLRLRQAHGYQSPGAFDYGRWMFASGYFARGYVRNPEMSVYLDSSPALSFNSVRQGIVDKVGRHLEKYRHGNIMKALLFADRSDIGREQWQIFARTGTNHLMAISGMHIGIVLAWGFFIGRVFGALLPRANTLVIGAYIALSFAFSYAALAGFSVPTKRALIMAMAALIAFCLRRNVSVWQAYITAMLLVLIVDPLAPHRAGFTLSFAAVGVLLFAFQGQRRSKQLGSHFAQSLFRSQWVVLLGLIPLLMMWGYGISPVSFPVNLLAIPLLTVLILPLLFCGLLLISLAPSLADSSWRIADYLLDLLLNGLTLASGSLPQIFIPISVFSFVLMSISILVLLLPRGTPAKWLAMVSLLCLFLMPPSRPSVGSAWVTTLDVGQGLSVLVQTATKTLLYDVGADFGNGFNTADAVVIPALRSFGIDKVDMLVVSHADRDHAGAAPALLQEIDVTELRVGENLTSIKKDALACARPHHWTWDGVYFEFLNSNDDRSLTGNNASCVLRLSSGETSLLLTGDIEKSIEGQLIQSGQTLSADVLIAPHHGSKTSSSTEFIRAVSPSMVVFSAGRNNRYGHPAESVTQRYTQSDARCWSTAYHGSIRFILDESGAALDKIWGGGRYYWQINRYSPESGEEICSKLHSGR
jgi:competence protein ComEC